MLDITANNLANTETPGFKAGRADFATQLSALVDASQGPNGTTGGRNPQQVGQGVIASSVQRVFTQGDLNPTGRDLDLAINGNGFFRLEVPDGTGRQTYTRVGNFGFDSNRQLVDLTTGSYVLGAGDAPTRIGLNNNSTLLPGNATSALTLSGNLAPQDAEPMHSATLGSLLPIRDKSGNFAGPSTLMSDSSLVQNKPVGNIEVNLVGTMGDGTDIPAGKKITITPGMTISQFKDALNDQLRVPSSIGSSDVAFAQVDYVDGSFTAKSLNGGTRLSLFLGEQAPPATTDAARNDFQFGAATDAFDWKRIRFTPSSVNTVMKVYTADGTQHQVSGKYINTGLSATKERTWDLILEKPLTGSLAAGGEYLRGLTMDASGRHVTDFTTSSLQTTWQAGGASTVALNSHGIVGYNADSFVDSNDGTGFPPGFLNNTTIDAKGQFQGTYSNGRTELILGDDGKPLQIGLVTFINNSGLSALANNQYEATGNSGIPASTLPGENGTNSLTPGALEGSNVELSSEFSKLIVSQRGFQSNSKAFQIADQMLEAANGLIR